MTKIQHVSKHVIQMLKETLMYLYIIHHLICKIYTLLLAIGHKNKQCIVSKLNMSKHATIKQIKIPRQHQLVKILEPLT